MTETRCIHDMIQEQCGWCSGPKVRQPANPPWLTRIGGHFITSQYRSFCPGCDQLIQPGDRIACIGGKWLCEECFE